MTITVEREQDQRNAQIERSLELAKLCAHAADQTRATDVRILNLTGVTPIVDYFVICTGSSRRQMHAIAEEVDRAMKGRGNRRLGIEGYDTSTWILQDYGDIVLHVFTEETRELYDLERLWADAKPVPWSPEPAPSSDSPQS